MNAVYKMKYILHNVSIKVFDFQSICFTFRWIGVEDSSKIRRIPRENLFRDIKCSVITLNINVIPLPNIPIILNNNIPPKYKYIFHRHTVQYNDSSSISYGLLFYVCKRDFDVTKNISSQSVFILFSKKRNCSTLTHLNVTQQLK